MSIVRLTSQDDGGGNIPLMSSTVSDMITVKTCLRSIWFEARQMQVHQMHTDAGAYRPHGTRGQS